MPEEYFDVAMINDDVILHGRIIARLPDGTRKEVYIKQNLNQQQIEQFHFLGRANTMALQKKLSEFANCQRDGLLEVSVINDEYIVHGCRLDGDGGFVLHQMTPEQITEFHGVLSTNDRYERNLLAAFADRSVGA